MTLHLSQIFLTDARPSLDEPLCLVGSGVNRVRRRTRSGSPSVIATVCSKWADKLMRPWSTRRPVVVEDLTSERAGVDHRLDGQDQPRLEPRPGAGRAVVRHRRILVHLPADAVADEAAHDRKAAALRRAPGPPADVLQPVAGQHARSAARAHSRVAVDQLRRASALTSPTAIVRAESPQKPSMNARRSRCRDVAVGEHPSLRGMPCTTSSLTRCTATAGIAVVAEERRRRPAACRSSRRSGRARRSYARVRGRLERRRTAADRRGLPRALDDLARCDLRSIICRLAVRASLDRSARAPRPCEQRPRRVRRHRVRRMARCGSSRSAARSGSVVLEPSRRSLGVVGALDELAAVGVAHARAASAGVEHGGMARRTSGTMRRPVSRSRTSSGSTSIATTG